MCTLISVVALKAAAGELKSVLVLDSADFISAHESSLGNVMFPKKQTSLYAVQRRLRSNSFNAYKGVMNELFQHYEHFDFVKTLQGYFRSGRYDLAVVLADSLSEQKYSDATMHFVANQFASLIRKYPWDPKVVKTDPEA